MAVKGKGAAKKMAFKSGNLATIIVTVLLAVSFLGLVGSFVKIAIDSQEDQANIQLAADLRAHMFQSSAQARDAGAGSEQAFDNLKKSLTQMEQKSKSILSGDLATLLPKETKAYEDVWTQIRSNINAIVGSQEKIIFLHDVAKRLNQAIPQLQQEYDNVVEILLDNKAPADQVAQARSQSWRAERIARNIDKMLAGGADAKEAADQFNYDANLFGTVLSGMQQGNAAMRISRVTDSDARESLNEASELFKFVSESVDDIFQSAPALFDANAAKNALLDAQPMMDEKLNTLTEKITGLANDFEARKVNITLLVILGGIMVICIGALLAFRYRATQVDLRVKESENDNNQQAILRLLDELADLADGDLTTTATVSEDFTGAIADSINYTIDQLRILVSQINDTAVKVSTAAQETQSTALHLAEASEHQAQEIAGASAAVNEMAVTIDQVSANASESSAVAERSVSIANKGAEVVQNTIQGMDNIREQIQETSKRIKRLGESSQEIGDIVSLINDIADQTNILALNAAIQASMAGDAGRGFAVVADEVQRLAERSSAATKQIEALVKTIQTDTNEAVSSMEQTTAEVVRGARLAQDAGVALEEIESVSSNLAELIQNISNAARQQASSAGHISNTMNVIQEITSQTSAGTNATAQSIGHLAEMAIDLRNSVAGFKLPEEARSNKRRKGATGVRQEVVTLDEEGLPEL